MTMLSVQTAGDWESRGQSANLGLSGNGP